MSEAVPEEPELSAPTGTFHYQELIESRLGQPISADSSAELAAAMALSPGARLAAARKAMGWTVERVAAELRLAPRQILALEAGDYAALPEPAVVRAFIRAYAKLVKLEAAPLVALIALEPGAKKVRVAAALPATSPETEKSGRRGSAFSFKPLAVALGIALLILLSIALLTPYFA